MTVRIGFGPITAQRGPADKRSWANVWSDSIVSAQIAEEAGFDSIWVGEHHFDANGYLPAVFPMLAAISVSTQKVMLGTKVLLAPLHHPLRIAEDAAGVQLLSNGRLILGLALGYRDEEFQAFGVAAKDRVSLLTECIDVCRRAWEGDALTFASARTQMAGVRMQPTPGPIPIWLGGRAAKALDRVGRIANGFVAPVGSADDLREQLKRIDAAAKLAERPAPSVASSAFILLRDITCFDSASRGRDALFASYADWKKDDPTSRVGQRSTSGTLTAEGDAQLVAGRLQELINAVPLGREHHLVVRLEYPGMSVEEVQEHVDVFRTQVLPLLEPPTSDPL